MEIFLESPLPAIFLGIVAAAVVGVVFVNTRKGRVLWALSAVLLAVLAGVTLERLVVTERETVEATFDGLADALEANDLEGVLSYVSPQAANTRQRASWALGLVTVREVKMRNMEIEINRFTSPPTARVRFTGTLFYALKQPQLAMGRDVYLAKFVVELEQRDGRWLVTDHIEHQGLGR